MKPISLKRFGRIVARVMDTLPPEFAPFLENLVVDVEEEPDPDMLRRSGYSEEDIAAGVDLLGLFAPLGSEPMLPPEDEEELPVEFSHDFQDQPHRLIIYKRSHEREFPKRRQFLIEVRKTVVHELAHHFGFNEKDLERFDDHPDPFGEDPDHLAK
ncbi:MAG: metallopeptidase family protein [Gemmataceae bacterium]|nr:metallopeptidase family protein [Gemmataceae bacterium]